MDRMLEQCGKRLIAGKVQVRKCLRLNDTKDF